MCGIFGLINSHNKAINKTLFKSSAKLMNHRGPNAYGQWGIENHLELAHLRLSIVDLSTESNQPFFSNCEQYVVVFNGEIYNYVELREQLKALGYKFKTESDTEVLLNSYIEWGEECVSNFNGDWSFAIYDLKHEKLFCSRDRFGVKPFNYAIVDGNFIFSSEIKSILNYYSHLKQPNYNVIANYCRTSVGAQHEETWFKDVLRLQPAHNLVYCKGQLTKYRYWTYPTETNSQISFDDAKNVYKELFIDSIKIRMRSDVPIGATLSAGIDSNSILFSLKQFNKQRLHTFTASFESMEYDIKEKDIYTQKNLDIDEANVVRNATQNLNVDTHFVKANFNNFINDLKNLIFYLESGHSSTAILPLMQVLAAARKEVTVVLEGQGADEMLGYQQKHFISMVIESLRDLKLKKALDIIKANSHTYSVGYGIKMYLRYLSNEYNIINKMYEYKSGINKIFGYKLKSFYKMKDYPFDNKMNLKFDSNLNKEFYRQHIGGLVNLLHYGDALSMANSIESRLPFMDYRLVEFVFTLPWEFKINLDLAKYIHRETMKGIVPESILNNPIKFGFNTPISQFFKYKNNLNIKPLDILLSDQCLNRGLFDKKNLLKLVNDHNSNKQNHSTLLYRILSVELWFQTFIDSELDKNN
jgi:asparagine synthase (glutamine-hydrolysing)